jgi:hypothetical protein
VLHPYEFFDKRVAPTPVSFARVAGVTPTYQNDLGEFETRLYLYQHLNDAAAASRAASGWNGDWYITFNTARGLAIAWASVWENAAAAADFYASMQAAEQAREPEKNGRAEQITTGEVGGRPVVLLVDTPAGVAAPISIADVRLGAVKQPSSTH